MNVERRDTIYLNVVQRTFKNQTHDTEKCRKKKNASDATKVVRETSDNNYSMLEEKHSFIFQVGVDVTNIDNVHCLLVDCGATTHIVHDVSKFFRFDAESIPNHAALISLIMAQNLK